MASPTQHLFTFVLSAQINDLRKGQFTPGKSGPGIISYFKSNALEKFTKLLMAAGFVKPLTGGTDYGKFEMKGQGTECPPSKEDATKIIISSPPN